MFIYKFLFENSFVIILGVYLGAEFLRFLIILFLAC